MRATDRAACITEQTTTNQAAIAKTAINDAGTIAMLATIRKENGNASAAVVAKAISIAASSGRICRNASGIGTIAANRAAAENRGNRGNAKVFCLPTLEILNTFNRRPANGFAAGFHHLFAKKSN